MPSFRGLRQAHVEVWRRAPAFLAGGGGLQFVDFTPPAMVLDAALFGNGHDSAIVVVGQK